MFSFSKLKSPLTRRKAFKRRNKALLPQQLSQPLDHEDDARLKQLNESSSSLKNLMTISKAANASGLRARNIRGRYERWEHLQNFRQNNTAAVTISSAWRNYQKRNVLKQEIQKRIIFKRRNQAHGDFEFSREITIKDLSAELAGGSMKSLHILKVDKAQKYAILREDIEYMDDDERESAYQEADRLNYLTDLKFPVIKNYGVLKIDGNPGVVLEYLKGTKSTNDFLRPGTQATAFQEDKLALRLTEKSHKDFKRIQHLFVEKNITIVDVQFLIHPKDGSLLIHDVAKIIDLNKTPNTREEEQIATFTQRMRSLEALMEKKFSTT